MKLHPFAPVSDLSIEAKVEPYANGFRLTFEVSGTDAGKVILPDPSEKPCRKDELWKATCFECFFGVGSSERYYEFNGSPSGDWALYSFDGYRTGMKNQVMPLVSVVPVLEKLEKREDGITCIWNVPAFTSEFLDRAGVTAVIATADGVSYWAIRHAGEKADFHLKESFVHRFF